MPSKSISLPFKDFFDKYLYKNRDKFKGKTIIDFPAGSRHTSKVLKDIEANVLPFDLFPEYFKIENIECKRADIMKGILLENNFADVNTCQEGIEHFSIQLFAFSEFNGILKEGGLFYFSNFIHFPLSIYISYKLVII